MNRRGIILAGGSGTRLHPLTVATSKQLLPVYDKPMIYYPLTTLMLAGIRDLLIISTPDDSPRFEMLLGNGSQWGLSIKHAIQDRPRGIADALLVAEDFIGQEPCALILGDNIFYGHGLTDVLAVAQARVERATIFAYRVKDPERYGVIELGADGTPLRILEKPEAPSSHFAVTGLYFYPSGASKVARQIVPSDRAELEITDLNNWYLERGTLTAQTLHRGFAWLDTGTHEALHQAASFVQTIQERQGLLVASPDEIAWRLGYISADSLAALAKILGTGGYARYILNLAAEASVGSPR